MEIQVDEFRKALEIVKPGLAAKATQEQFTSFAFTENNVVTYNDELCITHPLKGVDLQGAVQAEELYKFLTKIKTKTLQAEVEDSQVLLKSGRAKVGFALDSEIKLPLDDEHLTKKSKWKDLPKEFLTALNMARGSASTDMADPKLTCIHITKKGIVEATDNNRIFQYNLGEKIGVNDLLLPAKTATVINRLQPTKIAKGEEWIHFKNEENTTLSCRVLNEEFVDTEQFLTTDKKGVKLKFPKELAEALDTAEIFSKSSETATDVVTISVKKKKLMVSSESETSWFKDELDMESKSEKFGFQITPYLLKDILGKTLECVIYKDRLLFKGDNWKYVTALSGIIED